jgi:hypothetical protein
MDGCLVSALEVKTYLHYVRKLLLQRIIYSDFQLKTAVNGFTAVVKRKSLLSLQRLLAKNRCKIIYSGF